MQVHVLEAEQDPPLVRFGRHQPGRFADRFSVFAQYLVSDVKNRNFRAGDNGIDQLLRVQFTASFR